MGLKDYFKPSAAPPQPATLRLPNMSEKTSLATEDMMFGTAITTRLASSRSSLAPSTRSSTYIDEIKHEVMVNYLYQQQCSHLWVNDSSGQQEGVMLRKSRNNYMACPPQLLDSPFGIACAALNCQVSTLQKRGDFETNMRRSR